MFRDRSTGGRPGHIGSLNRRQLLMLSAAGAATAAVGTRSATARAQDAKGARIVIAGAGAAGLSMASVLSQRLSGAHIVLIDGRTNHYYQPGYTLVAAGLKPGSYTVSRTADYIPDGVELIAEAVAEFDPDGNKVVTESGRAVAYDFLVLATGMILDYGAIEGMDTARIGENGMGSHYFGPAAAEATWRAMSAFTDKGGRGLFLRPATEMKCAGAPLKYTFITDDYLRRKNTRGNAEIVYAAHNDTVFSVPIVHERVRMLFEDRGVDVRYGHVLSGIDIDAKIARFDTPGGRQEIDYDFINVIPPMRAPSAVRNSPLPWQSGVWAADGWIEVDKHNLRHARYDNIWAVGDNAGVPKGKTAASVKFQVPVAAAHLVAAVTDTVTDAAYDGYTSCPLITQLGRAMLVEFDYRNNLVPSFPGVVAPLEELWVTWVMKTIALKPTYVAMLRGRA